MLTGEIMSRDKYPLIKKTQEEFVKALCSGFKSKWNRKRAPMSAHNNRDDEIVPLPTLEYVLALEQRLRLIEEILSEEIKSCNWQLDFDELKHFEEDK